MSIRPRDVLSDILRQGAQEMLAAAIENEVAEYVDHHAAVCDGKGDRLVVRNGCLPARQIQTGLGLVAVQQPRVKDRRIDGHGERVRFSSQILPPYLRRTQSIEELIPWLYLRGISTGDFTEALQALLGPQAKGLSATNIVRLKESWQQEWKTWSKQSLAEKVYVHLWGRRWTICPREVFLGDMIMDGPGNYVPDPTEGIGRVEDLPPPQIIRRSRNYRRHSCPRCGQRAHRLRTAHRLLHDLGDPMSGRPRDLDVTYSQHHCRTGGHYFNADMLDLALPNDRRGACSQQIWLRRLGG